ncbi:MAG: YIP1 family protein [Caldilineaceae bacterium]|nr:YIP1 family protein [Caldilineaceae bacterium]
MGFKGMCQTWIRVLSRPGQEVFVAEKESASAKLSTALVWMILASIVSALLGLVQAQLAVAGMGSSFDAVLEEIRTEMPPDAPPELLSAFEAAFEFLPGLIGSASLSTIIVGPISFLFVVAIFHVIASLLRGQGQYGRFAYLVAAFWAPITIASSLLGVVPVVGGCVGAILAIYAYVLTYFAAKVEYGLSDGRAIIVVAAPILLGAFLFACLAIAIFGIAFSTIQNLQ